MIRRNPILAAFTALYSAGFLAKALIGGNNEFLFYFAMMLLFIALVWWADRRAHFSTLLLWLLSIWGFLHMAGGNISIPATGIGFGTSADPDATTTVLYNLWLLPGRWLKYDQITHAYGFFCTATACWQALRRFLAPGTTLTLAVFVIVACAAMGLGAVNEIVEYIATLRGPTNVGGYENNAQDLIFNAIGAVCGAIGAWIAALRGRSSAEGDASPIILGLVLTTLASILIGKVISTAMAGQKESPTAIGAPVSTSLLN